MGHRKMGAWGMVFVSAVLLGAACSVHTSGTADDVGPGHRNPPDSGTAGSGGTNLGDSGTGASGGSIGSGGGAGVAPDSGADGAVADAVEIISWWTNGAAEAGLDALFNAFREHHPETEIINLGEDASDPVSLIAERMKHSDPPDSFQALAGVQTAAWVQAESLESLSELATTHSWSAVFPAPLFERLSTAGELYAVPVTIERTNHLYYNTALLHKHWIKAPRTLSDFYEACETLKESKITPLALPAAGWALATVVFDNLMPSVNGGGYHRRFFEGKADLKDQDLHELFENFAKVIDCSNVEEGEANWLRHADKLYQGEAAMYVMGAALKRELESGHDADGDPRAPWTADEQFSSIEGLGSDGYFVYNAHVFTLPAGAPHPDLAAGFIETTASREGQQAANQASGTLPARMDLPLDEYDSMLRRVAEDYTFAASGTDKLLTGYAGSASAEFQQTVNRALLVFALGGAQAKQLDPEISPVDATVPQGDIDYMLGVIKANYQALR